MQATLIFNETAGGAKKITATTLSDALTASGYEVRYQPTSSPEDLDDALRDTGDLVVAVGGDGTLRAVAERIVGRDVPLAPIPLGTANNVARSLGLSGKPLELAAGLKQPRKVTFDVGKAVTPWGERIFLEAAGMGLFAELLKTYDPERGKSVKRALDTLRETALDYEPKRYRVKLDGTEISGTYVALEAMNTKATGPRLQLAPDAQTDDGLLDVVCILEPEGITLVDYTVNLIRGTLGTMPNVQILRGKRLELCWLGHPFHIDADAYPSEANAHVAERARSSGGLTVEVTLLPGALEMWLPQS